MKILIFCPYYPPHIGGLESHADEFNKYLSQRGADISVFTPRLPEDSLEFETRHQDVKIIRFPAFEIISNYPLPKFWSLKFWCLFFNLFKNKFDVVLSRTRFFNTSLLALIYAKIKRIQWIHIEHGSDFIRLSSNFKTLTAKIHDHTFGFLIFKFSDLNISVSQAVQKFIRKFDKKESPVVYRGLDFDEIDKIQPDTEFKEKFKNKIIVSWAGRLYKWKGVKNSILAIKNLPENIKSGIVFIIVGGGEDLDDLKKLSAEGDPIFFAGPVSREKTIEILKISNIYIHSSLPGGGLSTSLLESMYCGCAPIATPNEGANEVVGNEKEGFLIEKSEPTLILDKLRELVENKEKINFFSQNSKKKILEIFSWEKTANSYIKIFENQQNK